MMKCIFLIISNLAFAAQAFASACCGGGLAAPSMILGDDKAQVTASYSYSDVIADVGADSTWVKRSANETSEVYRIDAAHIFWDRWQAGMGLPLVKRALGEQTSSGIGDVAGTLAYEILPEWDYSAWRPRGFAFLQVTAPTGRSVYEADGRFQLDARGRGFWTTSAGSVFTKIVGKWDLFSNFDIHKSFNRSYSQGGASGTLRPGYGGSFGIGSGYNLAQYRFGAALTWNYEDPIAQSGTINADSSAQRYATAALSASYLLSTEWSATLTYTDQTWFGAPANTSLSRGVMLVAQKRWLR